MSHAIATRRFLQPEGQPILATAYVDAVATVPEHQGEGYGSAVMRRLVAEIGDYEIACLQTDEPGFYEGLGWEVWRGELAGRGEDGLIPTPEQRGVMVHRLAPTPLLDLGRLLTIECQPDRIWEWPPGARRERPIFGIRSRGPSATVAAVPQNTFVGRIAEGYDATSTKMFEPEIVDPVVDFLADLAGSGHALELGVGTGRIALPLSARGVPVHGIDISSAMVEKLREKRGSDRIAVTVGDFATTAVAGSFSLAYLVYNTIMNLTTQDEQVDCFRNVARHLEPGGCFVIEVVIPELRRLPPGETVRPFTVTPTHLGFDEYDVASQTEWSHHYFVVDGRLEIFSAPYRYVWPSELDLMARIAGLTLRERWGDWNRGPFTGESRKHVSVWEKAPEGRSHDGRR